VAIEQRVSHAGRRSTVATLTEIYHFLRLLFVKLGTQHCPDCAVPIEPQTVEAIVAQVMRAQRRQTVQVFAPLVVARKGYYTDLAKWAARRGYAALRVDGGMTPTEPWPRLDRFREHDIELPVAELRVEPRREAELRHAVEQALAIGKGTVRIAADGERGELFSTERACPSCGRSFEAPDPRLFSYNSKHGWCPQCYGTGVFMEGFDEEQTGEEHWWNTWWEGGEQACPGCAGRRLNPVALAVQWQDHSIAELNALPIDDALTAFKRMKLKGREQEIARDLLPEIVSRLDFLQEVGLGYLSLDRAAPTLSGGESQRIRLAAQLGSNLRGVCYVLDEPTIGLHPRDNRMLLATLHRLQEKGNTVVVVEHDEETIRSAEHVIDLGPGAGREGGHLVAAGTVQQIMRAKDSVTGRALAQPLRHPLIERRRTHLKRDPVIEVSGARLNNLRKIDVRFPLERLVCVTGVSGSGKSTLVREVLHGNLQRLVGRRGRRPKQLHGCEAIEGHQPLERVLEVDQTPIGKTPRSCPATYVGIMDRIRKLFAETTEARIRGYTASRFSFNTPGGRCAVCEGQGVRKIEMSFLPDVEVPCEACGGARYGAETLAVEFRSQSIGEVLAMSVDEAVPFFAAHPPVHHALRLLQDVGLGYLTLGQRSPTLSGGEAQRIKLVTELAKARPDLKLRKQRPKGTLYVLDEPTVGLHMADVEKLIRVLHRLVEAGNSVIVIEHNLDVIAEADWLIDLGPEGGDAGGRVVAQGTPERVAARKKPTVTGGILREFLEERRGYRDAGGRGSDR
jgi:excinuclease ABC subunit A